MFSQNYDKETAKSFFNNYLTYTITPFELEDFISDEFQNEVDFQIVDVRSLADYEIAHIPKAIHIPYDRFQDNLDKLDKNKRTVVYCYNHFCSLAIKCALRLVEAGFTSTVLLGGFKTWQKYRLKTEN